MTAHPRLPCGCYLYFREGMQALQFCPLHAAAAEVAASHKRLLAACKIARNNVHCQPGLFEFLSDAIKQAPGRATAEPETPLASTDTP